MVPNFREMADNNVTVPRGALVAMVVLLAFSMLGFAFLLGRQSAPPSAATPRPVAVESTPEAGRTSLPLQVGSAPVPQVAPPPPAPVYVPPAPAPVAVAPVVAPAPAPVYVPPAPAPVAAAPAPPPPPAPAPVAAAGPSQAVQNYFAKIDKIMAETESIGDQNAFATQVLQQGMNGKTEGFDNLIASTRKASTALRAITPPPNCKEHYALLIKQTEQSLRLLEKVKSATVSLDTGALTALGAEGQGMQADANRLKQLDEQLRAGR